MILATCCWFGLTLKEPWGRNLAPPLEIFCYISDGCPFFAHKTYRDEAVGLKSLAKILEKLRYL